MVQGIKKNKLGLSSDKAVLARQAKLGYIKAYGIWLLGLSASLLAGSTS